MNTKNKKATKVAKDSEVVDEQRSTERYEASFLADLKALTNPGPFLDDQGKIAPRMFRLEERIVFAYLLEETEDSFLVAFPALLKETNGLAGALTVIASQLVPTPLCRLLKSGIGLVSIPAHTHLFAYLSGSASWFKDLPGYFTIARVTQIEALVGILKDKLDMEAEVVEAPEFDDVPVKGKNKKFLIPPEMWPKQRH